MWNMDKNFPARGFSTPPPSWKSRPSQSPRMPMSERKRLSPVSKGDLFHVIHKVPTGDSPYVKAKQVQLIDRDPSKAISMFWAAINAGDRVDSALKDMALVMKQLNRSDEAIEAIKSFRHICPSEAQESLDNILVELYKRSGRIDEEIEMLHHKLKQVEEGTAFSGRKTKQARSQGKKIQITAEQEIARILGNLAWAYLQKNDYRTAEEHYRKALSLELDKNKQCNLAICLMQMNRITEAKFLLQAVRASSKDAKMDDPFLKSFERANQVLTDLESKSIPSQIQKEEKCKEIQRPVMSAIISKESNGTINESQQHDPGRGVSRCLVNGCNKEMVANRESSCGDYVGNNDNLSGIRSSSQYRPQVKSVGDWGKGSYNENSSGKCSGFGTSNKEKWSVTTGVEVKCAGPKVYTSSDPTRRNVNVPFTQPRRFPCGFRNGYQRKETWGGNHSQLIKNLPPCENSVNLGRRTWNNNAQVNDEDTSVMESNLRSTIEGDSDKMTPEDRKSASDGSWRSKLTSGSGARVFDGAREFETFTATEQRQSFDISTSSNVELTNSAGEKSLRDNSPENLYGLHGPISGSKNSRVKKSWADMVEEEEEEKELPSFSQNSEEEFNNENLNSNIIFESPYLQNQTESLSRKLETCDLKGGYGSSGNAISSRNPTARRSLRFGQQLGQESGDYFCASSTSPKKTLNFESYTVQEKQRDSASGEKIQLMRRKRLQVFRDITHQPDSP